MKELKDMLLISFQPIRFNRQYILLKNVLYNLEKQETNNLKGYVFYSHTNLDFDLEHLMKKAAVLN